MAEFHCRRSSQGLRSLDETRSTGRDKRERFKASAESKIALSVSASGSNGLFVRRSVYLGRRLSVCDSVWFPALKEKWTDWPVLSKYFSALKARPAIQKALAEEGLS